jgi:hypothetical protein
MSEKTYFLVGEQKPPPESFFWTAHNSGHERVLISKLEWLTHNWRKLSFPDTRMPWYYWLLVFKRRLQRSLCEHNELKTRVSLLPLTYSAHEQHYPKSTEIIEATMAWLMKSCKKSIRSESIKAILACFLNRDVVGLVLAYDVNGLYVNVRHSISKQSQRRRDPRSTARFYDLYNGSYDSDPLYFVLDQS